MKKEETKFYFRTIDSTNCETLEDIIHDAKLDELEEITVLEAVPDNNTSEYIWCVSHGEPVDRQRCKKSECSFYHSTSGRGVCSNRGKLYFHGNEVTFKVIDYV